jgi:hypothetical protein
LCPPKVTALKNFAEQPLRSELQSAEALQPGESGILIDGLKRQRCRSKEAPARLVRQRAS